MKNLIKRDANLLPLSVRFAKEYLDKLCEMQKNIGDTQKSKKLTTIHRALWTALIIEVGRLFDTYDSKEVISFKKLPYLKIQIDKYHGEKIIGKILKTRKTFTAHFATEANEVTSAPEICNSNLREILEKLNMLKLQNNRSEER